MAEHEILNTLVGVLCPTNEAASTCREFIQNHSNVLPPIGPLFYFLLFPAVFTILFVLLLMDNVGVAKSRSWGIKVLLGITAFIFIIISGWYPIMLMLSEFWYIIIILLGFLWFVTGHRGKDSGGVNPSGKMAALSMSGAMDSLSERAIKHATGELSRIEKDINMKLKDLAAAAQSVRNHPDSKAWEAYYNHAAAYDSLKSAYVEELKIAGRPMGGKLKEFIKKRQSIIDSINHLKPIR